MTFAEVKAELKQLAGKMKPLAQRTAILDRECQRLSSLAFIEVNNVQKHDVEMSSGDGKPWFGSVRVFAEWLAENSTRRFCEWNSRIYFTAEIINGRMDPGVPGCVDDLPE
jgi:hypothetical protein